MAELVSMLLVSKNSKDFFPLRKKLLGEFFSRNVRPFHNRRKKFSERFQRIFLWTKGKVIHRIRVCCLRRKRFSNSTPITVITFSMSADGIIEFIRWVKNELLPMLDKFGQVMIVVTPKVILAVKMAVNFTSEILIEVVRRWDDAYRYYSDIEGYGLRRPLELVTIILFLACIHRVLAYQSFKHSLAYQRHENGALLYKQAEDGAFLIDPSGQEIYNFASKIWAPNPLVPYQQECLRAIGTLVGVVIAEKYTTAKAYQFLLDLPIETDLWLPALILGQKHGAVQRKVGELGLKVISTTPSLRTMQKFLLQKYRRREAVPKVSPSTTKEQALLKNRKKLLLEGPKVGNKTLPDPRGGNQSVLLPQRFGFQKARKSLISFLSRLFRRRS